MPKSLSSMAFVEELFSKFQTQSKYVFREPYEDIVPSSTQKKVGCHRLQSVPPQPNACNQEASIISNRHGFLWDVSALCALHKRL